MNKPAYRVDPVTPIIAVSCGILNMLAAYLIILPGLAIPAVFFMTISDREDNVKAFGWFYLLAVIGTYYCIKGIR